MTRTLSARSVVIALAVGLKLSAILAGGLGAAWAQDGGSDDAWHERIEAEERDIRWNWWRVDPDSTIALIQEFNAKGHPSGDPEIRHQLESVLLAVRAGLDVEEYYDADIIDQMVAWKSQRNESEYAEWLGKEAAEMVSTTAEGSQERFFTAFVGAERPSFAPLHEAAYEGTPVRKDYDQAVAKSRGGRFRLLLGGDVTQPFGEDSAVKTALGGGLSLGLQYGWGYLALPLYVLTDFEFKGASVSVEAGVNIMRFRRSTLFAIGAYGIDSFQNEVEGISLDLESQSWRLGLGYRLGLSSDSMDILEFQLIYDFSNYPVDDILPPPESTLSLRIQIGGLLGLGRGQYRPSTLDAEPR